MGIRRLIGRPPVSDVFGLKGRAWLAQLELPVETLDSCLRRIAFLDTEIAVVDRLIARDALHSPQIRRLMSVPGVNVIFAGLPPLDHRRAGPAVTVGRVPSRVPGFPDADAD